MFLNTWNNLKGYVEIEVTGFSVARFVNLAVHRQIYIWDVKYKENAVRMKVSTKGFKMLRSCSKKTKCKIKIIEKHGLPFLVFRYRKRKFLAFGLVFLVITLYFLSSFVWLVNISGNNNLESSMILDRVAELGLKSGKWKYGVKNDEIERTLQNEFPEISWIDIHIKGTEANIKMTETIVKQEQVNRDNPCDIVALKDGLITNIITIAGRPIVKQKDVVKKGDMLVSGELILKDDDTGKEIRVVHSEAEVYAKLFYEINFKVPFKYEEKFFSGETKNKYNIKMFNKYFKIPSKEIDFINYDKSTSLKQIKLSEKYPLPLIIITEKYKEFSIKENIRNIEQAKEAAQRIVNSRIIREFSIETDVVDKNLEFNQEEDCISVNAIITTIERIDSKMPIDLLAE